MLGAADDALEHAGKAIATFERTPAPQRNAGTERMVRLLKVRAHLALGQFDGAEDALTPVLETAPTLRAKPLLARMSDIYADVAATLHAAEPIAIRIRSEVRAFQQAAAAPELAP